MTAVDIDEDLNTSVVSGLRDVLGYPGSPVGLHEPEFAGREWEYVKDCIDSGWVSSVGSYVDRFERDLADFCGSNAAVAAMNGTAALHIAYLLAGVEAGDEVLVPTLTFVATVNAISYCGAVPHFVDSDERTLGVSVAALEDYLESQAVVHDGSCISRISGKVIRALVVTHIFGHPADLDALKELCDRWRIALVEDAAEALGSLYKGRHVGNTGIISTLSFNGNKIITTGGGGALLINDPELARRAKHITTTAKQPHRWAFNHDEVGYNYRLPNLNAALGCAQLEQMSAMLERKRVLADRYRAAFHGRNNIKFIDEPGGCRSNFWLNGIIVSGLSAEKRSHLLDLLNEENFMCRPVWNLMHKLPMYANCPRAPLEVAEQLEREVINIPSSARLAGT